MAEIYGDNARVPGTSSAAASKWPMILIALAVIAAIIIAVIYMRG